MAKSRQLLENTTLSSNPILIPESTPRAAFLSSSMSLPNLLRENYLLNTVKPSTSASPSITQHQDDYLDKLPPLTKEPTPPSPDTLKRAPELPYKFRPLSDYQLCDKILLERLKIKLPEASAHTFALYIKRKDIHLSYPSIYFIKTSYPNSYNHELEALCAYIFNLIAPNITPSAHVIYDDTKPDNLPIGIVTRFRSSFIPVKDQPIKEEDLKNPEIIKWLARIFSTAYLFEDDDLHARQFGWISENILMRVDTGMALWNYLRLHPKLSSFLGPWGWRTGTDRLPVTVKDIEEAPNYTDAKPYYCPTAENFLTGEISDTFTALKSKNQFRVEDIAIYRNPENLQLNPVFVYNKFKLLLKSMFIRREVIEGCSRLFLRTTEGNNKLDHVEKYTSHLIQRLFLFREKLFESEQFKNFIINNGPKAANEVWDEFSALYEKIETKMDDRKKLVYQGIFKSVQANPFKEKWKKLQEDITFPRARR